MTRVLIAGGAGFIGSHLCRSFVADQYSVTCIDNLSTGFKENTVGLDPAFFRFIEADICEPLPSELGPFDFIINLACPASPVLFESQALDILRVCSEGQRNLLELARSQQALFLFASSSEVYGEALQHPQNEDYNGNVPLHGGRSCYEEGKRFGETLCYSYSDRFNLDIRVVRIFNTYGPGMAADDGRLVPNFISQALRGEPLTIYGDGLQTRSFCFVSDMIDGLRAVVEASESGPLNLGNPQEVTVYEVGRIINELLDNASGFTYQPLPDGDPRVRRPDIARVRSITGWQPEIDLMTGLRKTIWSFKETLGETD